MKRIGIIGLNNKAIHHIERIKEMDDFKLIGLYDHNAVLAKNVAKKHGLQSFHHPIDIIEQSEIIDFVAPHTMDYEHASMAIKSARHLFFEDYFLQDINKTTKLLNLVDEAQVKVQISRSDRFNPAVQKARKYIKNPSFIETRRAITLLNHSNNSDPIMELLIKDVDLILSFIDSGIKRIQTRTNNPYSSKVELINVRIEFDNSCVANINLSSLSSISYNKAALYQNTGVIHIDLQECELEILSSEEEQSNKIVSLDSDVSKVNILGSELQSFYNCIDDNTIPIVSLRDVANVLEIVDEIKRQISF